MKKVTNTQLESLLRSVNVDPSREWKDNTLLQLDTIMNDSNKSSEISLIRKFLSSRIFMTTVIFSLIVVIALITIILAAPKAEDPNLTNTTPRQYLSDEEEKKILTQLIENNSLKTEGTDLTQTETQYNYRITTYEMRQGPAYSPCLGDVELEFGNVIQESYEFAQDDKLFYMWSSKLTDGTQISYELTKNKQTSSEWIRYRGGSFALREYSTFVASEGENTIGEKQSFEELISTYGIGYAIYQDENGDFIMEQNVRHVTDCGEEKSILSIIVIDPKTFEVKKYQDYLIKGDSQELINESITNVTNDTISPAEADQLFKFSFNVEVKNIATNDTLPNKATMERLTKELFKNNQIIGLILPEEEYTIEITTHTFDDYSQVYLAQYYADRGYYPAGSIGDSMFHVLKNRSENQIVTMGIIMRSKTSDYEGISLTIVKGEDNYMRLPQFNEKFTPYKSNISINNETVEVNVYDSKWPPSERTTTFFTAERASFTYKGDSYNLTINTQNENFKFTDLNFRTIDTQDADDFRFIEEHLIINGYAI